MSEIFFLALSIVLVLLCGLFVAAEFSLISVSRVTVERLAGRGDHSAIGIKQALDQLSTQLSGAQIGITITNLVIGYLAEPSIAHLIEPSLTQLGWSEPAVNFVGLALGVLIATLVTMIFGELVPKNLAISNPLLASRIIQKPIRFFSSLVGGPIIILNGSANLILKAFGVTTHESLATGRSADELLSLVRHSAKKGTLTRETALMLERSLSFGDLTAVEVMTPRVRVKAVSADDSIEDLMSVARASGLSRFPVYNKTLDDVVGVVHIKHVMSVAKTKRAQTKVRQIMKTPVFVPSNMQLEPLLEALRWGGLQMAIVVDEFGGTDGIVTLEDLFEELVGEVRDEHDNRQSSLRQQPDGSWSFSGLLRPDEINDDIGIALPEDEDFDTVAGLIAHRLERMPHVGDSIIVEAVHRDGAAATVKLTVDRLDGRRIDRVSMILQPTGVVL